MGKVNQKGEEERDREMWRGKNRETGSRNRMIKVIEKWEAETEIKKRNRKYKIENGKGKESIKTEEKEENREEKGNTYVTIQASLSPFLILGLKFEA